MLDYIRFFLTAGLLIAGLIILAAAVRGVYKYDYVLNRMQTAATADTLGLLFCLGGLLISLNDLYTILKFCLIIVFFWTAGPVSSHLMARLEFKTNPRWSHIVDAVMTEDKEEAQA